MRVVGSTDQPLGVLDDQLLQADRLGVSVSPANVLLGRRGEAAKQHNHHILGSESPLLGIAGAVYYA